MSEQVTIRAVDQTPAVSQHRPIPGVPEGWYISQLTGTCGEGDYRIGTVTLRRIPTEMQVVPTLPLTPESQQIVEHPELFWVTSMSGTSFSKFAVDVREVE